MIRADQDPASAGTVDPNANGTGIPGYWNTGPICTILGPDSTNHLSEEVARILTSHGIELDFANKGQIADLLGNTGGVYGDGSDGDVTIAVATSLTRDVFYDNLTINPGIRLNMGGRKIFVRNTLTFGDGSIISANGSDGSNFSGAPPLAAGGAGQPGFSVGGGGTGGTGGDGAGAVTGGDKGSPFPSTGYSGSGGAGGNGSPGAGQTLGQAGGVIVPSPVHSPAFIPAMQTGMSVYQTANASIDFMLCGGGGGGGGGAGGGANSSNGYGAGGGGGGGVALISARVIVGPTAPAGPAFIEAIGGDGGFDSTPVVTANGGGGGGGGGGTILLTSRVQLGDPGLLILDASGGAGGLASTAGNGTPGVSGSIFELRA